MTRQSEVIKFAKKIKPFQIKIEAALMAIIIAGIILFITDHGTTLIAFGLGTLSILYYLMAFNVPDPDLPMHRFFHKLIYWSYAIAVVSIIFRMNHYEGSDYMMIVALFTLAIYLIRTIILAIQKKKVNFIEIIRSIIIILILLILNFYRFF